MYCSPKISTRKLLFAATALCGATLFSGCGVDTIDHSVSGTSALHGMVHGGQQPVSGSVIRLYTVGQAGNGSAAFLMLTGAPILTGADGSFDITDRYTCGQDYRGHLINSPSNQIYITASEGNPGLTPPTDNAALSMMTAIGDCSSLTATSYIEINEITTAAAAWALAPFITPSAVIGETAGNVGASSTNVSGITNAFLDAALLADSSNGQPATIASNLTVETSKLISLANALGACVNSDGTTGCTPLFGAATPTGSLVPPLDTFAAAVNIVKNPGENVQAVYTAIGDRPPFSGGLSTYPNDWTMSLTVSGGGLNMPTALAIDSQSNVWVVSQDGPLSVFNAQGNSIGGSPFGVGLFDNSHGIAIDTNDDIWVVEYNALFNPSGAVVKVLGVNSGSLGTLVLNTQVTPSVPGFFSDIYYSYGVSADTYGNIFVANTGRGATVLNSDGTVHSGYLGGQSMSALPNDITSDANHGYWLPDDNYSVFHISASGVGMTTNCCFGSFGVATDAYDNVWVANEDEDTISAVEDSGALLLKRVSGGGLANPSFVAVDAAQNVWFSNFFASITEIAGQGGALTVGTPISPAAGVLSPGGYGLDAGLGEPKHLAPDRAGNLWLTDLANSDIVMFFGLAAPTATPVRPSPVAP